MSRVPEIAIDHCTDRNQASNDSYPAVAESGVVYDPKVLVFS